MINIKNYSTQLIEREGIYFSNKASKISYPETGNDECFQIEADSFWFKHRNNCIAEGVLRYLPGDFFDLGGGNGFVSERIENIGISTVLVEPGIQGCLNAKKRNLKTIVCSTVENAGFENKSIPAIGLFDVVEHIENDIEFLTTIHKLLIDKGLIFITVPAYNFLWSDEDTDAGHYRRYTRKELEKKLLEIGFTIEYSTYIFSILITAVFLFRSLPSKLGFYKKPNNPHNYKKSYGVINGFMNKVLNIFWKFELRKIRKGRIIPFGGSCFLIARKIEIV